MQLLGPVRASADQVLSMSDQALVEVAGEHRDAISSGVMPEEMAGETDRVAAAGLQLLLIKLRPFLQRLGARVLDAGEGERDHDSTACVHPY